MPATLTEPEKKESRRINRMKLNLPVRVQGQDSSDSAWDEITRLRDVSSFGAGFALSRPVKTGRLLKMTLPMPRQMRCYDFFESQYNVWGIVRQCISTKESSSSSYLVGVAFIGKMPPKSYLQDPSKIYDIAQNTDDNKGFWTIRPNVEKADENESDLRRQSRYDIPINLTVESVDEAGNIIESEPTVTENISLGGASIFTSLEAEVGSRLAVTSPQYQTTIKAIVRGRRVGPDGIPRLHVEFIDHLFPLTGIDND